MINQLSKLKILNVAWIGQGDFGDEAMAYALRLFLKSKGIAKITYYQHGDFVKFRGPKDLHVRHLHSFKDRGMIIRIKDFFLLRKFNIFLIGGGSILHSFNNIRWKLNILEKLKKIRGKKLFSAGIGISIDPFKTIETKKICAQFFTLVDFLLFRDNYSAQAAKKISDNKKIIASLDSTLLLPELCPEEIAYARNLERDKNLVGIMFVRKKGEEEFYEKNQHFKKYLDIINHVLDQEKRVFLFTLYIGDLYPDIALNEELKKQSKFPDWVEIIQFDGDIFKIINKLSQCGFVISMRLHGIIISYLLSIPFLSLSYNQKNQNFCESIGYPLKYSLDFYNSDNFEKILGLINQLFTEGDKTISQSLDVDEAAAIVKNNYESFFTALTDKLL